MNILSVITVRKDSKGLINKCVIDINGKAVFEYSLEYSLKLDQVLGGNVYTIVSSDSEKIKEYCLKNNVEFLERSSELTSDIARIEDVVYDAYLKIGKGFDYISILYGNIPVRYPEEFLKAYEFLEKNKDYDAVLSMQNVEKFNPSWMFEFNDSLLPLKRSEGYRRQDLKQLMIHDGHTILFRTGHFLKFMEEKNNQKHMYEAFGRRIKPMLNDKVIIDIDTERDIMFAETILRLQNPHRGEEKHGKNRHDSD